MNNEPVAWMDEETGCFVYSQYDYEDLDEHGKDGLIPLYTHPIKELTDDEVRLIHEQTDGNLNMIQFARAILRKAQEK
jgi:predicted SnoaL-like aldol condensation-catalyzing enzyme